jgi:CDP-diglyceride synthetase
MDLVLRIPFLLLPVILAGISNMVFVKLPVLGFLRKPMDGGKVLKDGGRLFGDNKTWKGFLGMIVLTSLWMGVVGLLCRSLDWADRASLVRYREFVFPYSEWFYGALWGLGYVLFELPNSFMKRRLRIEPGKNKEGRLKFLFMFIDQADSAVGIVVFLFLFRRPSLLEVVLIFVIGSGLHYVINVLLYLARLKKQMG